MGSSAFSALAHACLQGQRFFRHCSTKAATRPTCRVQYRNGEKANGQPCGHLGPSEVCNLRDCVLRKFTQSQLLMDADDAGGAKKRAGVRLRDKSLANAQRKDQRRRQKVLIEHLDDLLPPDAKRLATTNGAGVRAIGLSGRSLHNVLHDVVDHLHALRRREAAQLTPDSAQPYVGSSSGTGSQSPDDEAAAMPAVGPMETHMHRCGIVSSHSLAAIELSMPDWSIARLNPAGRALFGTLPWLEFTGQCLLNSLVHGDDVCALQQLWADALARTGADDADSGPAVRKIRLWRCLSNPRAADAAVGAAGTSGDGASWAAGTTATMPTCDFSYVDAVMVAVGGCVGELAEGDSSCAVLLCVPRPELDCPQSMNLGGRYVVQVLCVV